MSIGYKQKIALTQLKLMSQLPVRTHEWKAPERKRNPNYLASKLGGIMGRKRSGL